MSNLEARPEETTLAEVFPAAAPVSEHLSGRKVPLGRYAMVRRYLPQAVRRMIGSWCFLDAYGPDDVSTGPGMRIPPHPHTGLQTVSWLLDGEILHRDSLGSVQTVRPGQLNLMTAGRGIAHSEESPPGRPATLTGLQLWLALPDADRRIEPRFEHHAALPLFTDGGLAATVLVGSLGELVSPARVHAPLVGADVAVRGSGTLPLDPAYEYGVLPLRGPVRVDGGPVPPDTLLYLGRGRAALPVSSDVDGRLLLLGGEPFGERLVMWWNFVGRSHEEIVAMRSDWAQRRGFDPVRGFDGDALPAPSLPGVRLKPR
jgi:redox-sensitive bicupin YhaK (pirin superfamily)